MKILHTSDWHLGHALYNYDRSEEQICFLNQLTGIVQEEQPDVMVVSGDIYHYSTPSAATQKMYTDGLLRIHQACPSMTIVVTAGNHDSSSKLEIDSNLWDHFRVKVIGHIERCGSAVNWEKQIITIPGQDGNPVGYIAAMPHVYPQNFPILSDDTPREERQSRFFQALLDETGKQNTQQLPVVLMAHLSVESSDRTGQDDSAGGMEFISLSTLGKGYDYLALGHIHSFSKGNIDKRGVYAYSGCPEGRGFDECGEKGFVLFDTQGGVAFKPYARRTCREIKVDVSGCDGYVSRLNRISKEIAAFPADDMFKIVLTGETQNAASDLSMLRDKLSERLFFVKIEDNTKLKIDRERLRKEMSLKGEFFRTVERLKASPEEKEKILRLGLKAMSGEEADCD